MHLKYTEQARFSLRLFVSATQARGQCKKSLAAYRWSCDQGQTNCHPAGSRKTQRQDESKKMWKNVGKVSMGSRQPKKQTQKEKGKGKSDPCAWIRFSVKLWSQPATNPLLKIMKSSNHPEVGRISIVLYNFKFPCFNYTLRFWTVYSCSDIHLLPFPHVENPNSSTKQQQFSSARVLTVIMEWCLVVGRPTQPQRSATKLYDTDTLKNWNTIIPGPGIQGCMKLNKNLDVKMGLNHQLAIAGFLPSTAMESEHNQGSLAKAVNALQDVLLPASNHWQVWLQVHHTHFLFWNHNYNSYK